MEEDKDGGLILGEEPTGQAGSAAELQNNADSVHEAPLPQIGGENDEMDDDDDGGEQPAKALDAGFGAEVHSTPVRQQPNAFNKLESNLVATNAQEEQMRAKIVDALAQEHSENPPAGVDRRGVKPGADDGSAGKAQANQGHVKPITVRIFQIPDQLQERTRAEKNIGRNAQRHPGLKFKGAQPLQAVHATSVFQVGSSINTTLEHNQDASFSLISRNSQYGAAAFAKKSPRLKNSMTFGIPGGQGTVGSAAHNFKAANLSKEDTINAKDGTILDVSEFVKKSGIESSRNGSEHLDQLMQIAAHGEDAALPQGDSSGYQQRSSPAAHLMTNKSQNMPHVLKGKQFIQHTQLVSCAASSVATTRTRLQRDMTDAERSTVIEEVISQTRQNDSATTPGKGKDRSKQRDGDNTLTTSMALSAQGASELLGPNKMRTLIAAQPHGMAAAGASPSGAASPGKSTDYQMSTSALVSACTSREQAQTLPSIGNLPNARKGKPHFMHIKENMSRNWVQKAQQKTNYGRQKSSGHWPADQTLPPQQDLKSRTHHKRFTVQQDHSKYTSYPAAAPLRTFNNLNETFNSNTHGFQNRLQGKRTSQFHEVFDQSLYSKHSQDDSTNIQTFTNYKMSIVNGPPTGQMNVNLSDQGENPELGTHTPVILPGGSFAVRPAMQESRSSSPAQVFVAMKMGQQVGIRQDAAKALDYPAQQQIHRISAKHAIMINKQSGHLEKFGRTIQQNRSFFAGKGEGLAEVNAGAGPQDQGRFRTQARNQRATHTAEHKPLRKNHANQHIPALPIAKYHQPLQKISQQAFDQHASARNDYPEHGMLLNTGASNQHFLTSRFPKAHELADSVTARPQKKFAFLKKIDDKLSNEHNSILHARHSQSFVPYTQERNAFGQLLQYTRQEGHDQGDEIEGQEAAKGQEAQQMSRLQTLQPIKGKRVQPLDGLNALDLHNQIVTAAQKKRNDPLALTTEQNLRRIKDNARLKLKKQIEFSKRNGIEFQAVDAGHFESASLEFDLQTCQQTKDTQRDTNFDSTQISMYRNNSQVAQHSQTQSLSLPEGVEQIKVQTKYVRLDQHRGSAQGRAADPLEQIARDGHVLATDRMTYRSGAADAQIEHGFVNLKNFVKNKIAPQEPADEQGHRTGGQTPGREREPSGIPELESTAALKERLKKSHKYFELNLPNSRSLWNPAGAQNTIVNKPMTFVKNQVHSYIKPLLFDIVREQTKEKMKQNLKYCTPAADQVIDAEKQIPLATLAEHVEEFKEFPSYRDYLPDNHVPTTFGTSPRFLDPQFEYTQEAVKLSMLDFHDSVFAGPNQAPAFGKYAKRKDNFLTKSQELLNEQKRDGAAMRIQRLQQMKESQEQENKEREKNAGPGQGQSGKLQDGQQVITFTSADHTRVLAMRPHVKNMVAQITEHAKQLVDSEREMDLDLE